MLIATRSGKLLAPDSAHPNGNYLILYLDFQRSPKVLLNYYAPDLVPDQIKVLKEIELRINVFFVGQITSEFNENDDLRNIGCSLRKNVKMYSYIGKPPDTKDMDKKETKKVQLHSVSFWPLLIIELVACAVPARLIIRYMERHCVIFFTTLA